MSNTMNWPLVDIDPFSAAVDEYLNRDLDDPQEYLDSYQGTHPDEVMTSSKEEY